MNDAGWTRLIEHRIDELERKVDSLRLWRSWVLGAAAVSGVLAGALAKPLATLIVGHA